MNPARVVLHPDGAWLNEPANAATRIGGEIALALMARPEPEAEYFDVRALALAYALGIVIGANNPTPEARERIGKEIANMMIFAQGVARDLDKTMERLERQEKDK